MTPLRETHPTPLRSATYQQMIRKSITASAYLPPATRGQARITATDARAGVDDLSRPALVVLENQMSDGILLRAVLTAFG